MAKLLDFGPRKLDNMQSYICVKSLVRLDVYKKAGIVRIPKQREGWELKKWEAWERELGEVEDTRSNIHKTEHGISVLAQQLGKINQVLQRLPDDVIRQCICMELNQMLQHMPDGPDQPRSLRRLNWVEQKRDMEKLVARSNKINDIIRVLELQLLTILLSDGDHT